MTVFTGTYIHHIGSEGANCGTFVRLVWNPYMTLYVGLSLYTPAINFTKSNSVSRIHVPSSLRRDFQTLYMVMDASTCIEVILSR